MTSSAAASHRRRGGADWQALLLAATSNPDEGTPRLAPADWLDESGEGHDRAPFLTGV